MSDTGIGPEEGAPAPEAPPADPPAPVVEDETQSAVQIADPAKAEPASAPPADPAPEAPPAEPTA